MGRCGRSWRLETEGARRKRDGRSSDLGSSPMQGSACARALLAIQTPKDR